MSQLFKLSDVSFGQDDATIEARQGFLGKVFLKTSFYNRVKSGQKFLVTGRKGSGKSAICFYLIDALNSERVNTIFANSRLLSRPKMQQLKDTAINEQEKFESVWRYALLVKAAIKLLEIVDSDEDIFFSDSQERQQLKEIKLFLAQNNEIGKDLWQKMSSFFNIFSKFSAKLPGGVEAGLETRQIETIRDLSNMLDKFEHCISCLVNKSQLFKTTILIDEIDDIWDHSEDSKSLIIGLLNAVNKLNAALNPSVVILVFLRSDIWDSLGFASKDKYRSVDERISWSDVDLKQLIVNRGRFTANLLNDSRSNDDIIDILFDKKVKDHFSLDYIIDRTLKRPREVIQFCNLALSVAQDNGHSRITERDILAAESRYSVWKLDDLLNEFSVQYPFLRDALNIFDGFRSFFTKSEIASKFEDSKRFLASQFPKISDLDLNSFLQILFSIGFIGAKIGGKDLYLHDEPDRPRIVLANLENLDMIIVHPAFHSALGLSRYTFEGTSITQVNQGITNYNIQIGGSVAGNINTGDVNQK
jgi:Cdc6-like AAA superfamily ATPase